jgi:hypothetical protein
VKIYGLEEDGTFDTVEMTPMEEDIMYSLALTWLLKNAQLQHHNGYAELSIETLHPYIYGGEA